MAIAMSELTYPALLPRVADVVRGGHNVFINGAWVTSQSGETLAVFDPATGCAIVLKPAEQTPLSALRLGEDAGAPPGGATAGGTIWVNGYNVFDAALPVGGYKDSGWGREMGHDVLNNYLQTKAVCASL